MASPAQPSLVFRFGQFELDAASGELRKAGVSLKLHPQPFRVLLLLAERPKQIVSRDEIQRRLWGDHTFVDFERGINSCVNQIRATLGDDPEKPRYIETLPRRGYRFIASVTTEHRAEPAVTSVSPTVVP
ncbi:MAG: winged helix-turn-helix domain-containing protein, partial [Candidatus Acidiferrales bacterium]